MKWYLSIIISLIIFSHKSYAQSSARFKVLDQSRGLSSGSITSIVQDEKGFLWIGTKNGIDRYDGFNFKVYSSGNSNLAANDISCLRIDTHQRIWAGTIGGGVSVYDPAKDLFTTFLFDPADQATISSNDIQVIFQDKAGSIWIGTEEGLNKFNEEDSTFTRMGFDAGNPKTLNSNKVMSVYEDEAGNFWIGTFGGGLNLFHPGKGTFEQLSTVTGIPGFNTSFVWQVTSFKAGKLLVATSGSGLLEFDIRTRTFSEFLPSPFNEVKIIRSVLVANDHTMWVGTDGDGLLQIENYKTEKNVKKYVSQSGNPASLSSDAIYTIFMDKDKNLWIGTAWNGLDVLDHRMEIVDFYFSDIKGENRKGVLSIYENQSELWFGTDGLGLTIWNQKNNGIQYYAGNTDIGDDYIQLIRKDKDDSYWLGTFRNGLIHFITGKGIHYANQIEDSHSISHNDVRDILNIGNGKYLVATWGGGLNLFDEKASKFRSYRYDNSNPTSIGSDNIISLLEDGNGKVWVATFGGGLNLYDPASGEFKRYRNDPKDQNSLSGNNILSLFIDSHDELWVGTWGDGLNRYDPDSDTFYHFDVGDGLSDNTITAIQEDDQGRIWVSTKQGINRIAREPLEVRSFPELDGEYHINSSFKNGEGKLFFGNTRGVVSFFPDKVDLPTLLPDIQFTDFRIFNKPLQAGAGLIKNQILYLDKITLPADKNVLTFDFAALEYPFSDQFEYAYKLENAGDSWITLGNQHSVTFSNLMPGTYTLYVKGADENDWSNHMASMKIVILKPWWKEWWAVSIYFLIFLGLLFLFQRYIAQWEKLKHSLKLEKLSREKEAELHDIKMRFFTNLSHEIRTPVTLMLGVLNKMEEDGVLDASQKKGIAQLRKNGNRLSQLLNELLDFRKLETAGFHLKVSRGNIVKFGREVFLSFKYVAGEKEIDYKFYSQSEKINIWYDKDQIEKVLYNLLANAFKYANTKGTISFEIEHDDENVFIRITNTGNSIPKEHLQDVFKRFYQSDNALSSSNTGVGLGLAISKEIVHLHSGELQVESEMGKTTFTVKMMHGNSHFSPAELIHHSTSSEDIEKYYNISESITEEEFEIIRSEISQDKKILVVDDNREVREYIIGLLKNEFTILEAPDGLEALEIIHGEMPDLVICDVVMPEMDGITLTGKIKSNKKTSHIPVIILTARTSLIYKKEGYETGADEYITKPFSEALLKTRIRSILRNRELISEKLRNDFITQPRELAISTPDQQFLEDMIRIIEENIDKQELNAEFISREMAMSHSVVYKKIKALTGLSLIEFIRDFKLKRAAQLMAQYHFSISDACHKVGFSDRKYFTHIFKIKFGVTPSEYIKINVN